MSTSQEPSLPDPQPSISLATLYVQLAKTLGLIVAHPDCLPAIREWLVELITIITEARRPYCLLLSKRTSTGEVRSH
ncbi:MAG TPA: hypothetical protein PLD20_30240 [Blastocatellia bacterium]|nr:hypothetical protein [Blastocatellia bacterium]HMX29123.1 hypothetical protein [Blastocatellia bacterium]HMY74654.1 hypothetical protein [Blastocatellia bacterium]HMZ22250.1 hypothetical protein [Blastocatellia bacterium]HNG32599.1 hypothetical protein [Blastocatellia bacterium]